MAMHLGYSRAGWPGLLAGGACFILPAMAIVWALAWAYARYGAQPQVGWLLYGVKPVIIAVVVQAIWGLGRTAARGTLLAAVALAVLALSLAGANEIVLLLAGGLVVPLARAVRGAWVAAELGARDAPGRGRARRARAVPNRRERDRLAARRRARGTSRAGGPRRVGRRRRRAGGDRAGRRRARRRAGHGDRGAREPHHAVRHVPQDRLRPLRQRLRAPRVPPERLRPPPPLAHRPTAPRRRRDRSVHARPGAHDRHVRRLSRRWRCRGRPRDRRHLPAVVRVRRGEPPAPAEDSRVALGGGVSRRRQRRRARPDGGGDVGARAGGGDRLADGAPGARRRGPAHPTQGQLGLADPRRRRPRPRRQVRRRLTASRICRARTAT